MKRCKDCGKEFLELKIKCPHCGTGVSEEEKEIIGEIERLEERRNRFLVMFILGMFGMWILPFLTLIIALISFGMALPMSIYQAWKKRRARKDLRRIS